MTTVYNKDGIPFDIDALATDINGKADKDLSNFTTLSKSFINEIMNAMMPDYANLIQISANTSSYTAPKNGIIIFNLDAIADCTINGKTINIKGNDSGNEGSVTLPLTKGDVIILPATSTPFCFVPFKGAM